MARNKMSDLRDHMFVALERLNDESLTPEQRYNESITAKQIASIGAVLVNSAKVECDFLKATGQMTSNSELFKDISQQKQLETKIN
jgi:uncharacterized protein YpuA (DUF1002 family)